MWLKSLLLCSLLSFYSACSEPLQHKKQEMTTAPTDLADWFQDKVSHLRHYQQSNWPADSDARYVDQALRISFEYKTVMLKDPDTLREALIVYLETQKHPEAQCVSFDNTEIDSEWSQLQFQIVCR